MPSLGYGLTEVNGVAAALAGDMYHHNPTAVGYPPPAVDLKIVDPETLITCNEGDVGELWIRGPGVAKGYWNRPKATAEAFLPDVSRPSRIVANFSRSSTEY